MAEYACRYCGERLGTREEYDRHMVAAHPAGGRTTAESAGIGMSGASRPAGVATGGTGGAGQSDIRTVADTRDIADTGEVGDTRSVGDTGSVGDIGTGRRTSEAEGRGESDVGDWRMGQNDDVPSRGSRAELPAFRCSSCGEEFGDHEALVAHIDSTHRRGELTA